MTIYFNSDTSLQKDGFDLLVEFIDESSLCTLSYSAGEGSGTMAGVTRLAGSTVTVAACGFTAPEYTAFDHYTDGINNYDVGDTVTLSDDITLTAVYVPTATVVYLYDGKEETSIVKVGTVITLEDFDEMFYAPPRHSFICWRDEADGAEYDAGDSFTVNATAVFDAVVEETEPFFISDGAGGWYAKMPDSGDDYVDLSDKAPGFSFTLYDDGGPDGNYSDRCDGYLNLTAPYGCVFSISGNVATEATFDYVKVYDGENLAGILYGTETVDVYETSGEALRIDFHSDSLTNYEGFALTVTVVMHPVETGINYNYQTTYSETVMTGDTITLATFRNAFERFGRYAPEGKRFAGWRDTRTGLIYAEGASYFVGGFTEFEPVFEDTTPWAAMNTSLAAMGGSVTVSLTEDLVASAGDTPIVFPVDALVTLDLAGYSIDGTLAADEDGSIMIVNGGLTIVDSVGGGEITGGNITAYKGAPVSIDAAADRFDATLTQKYGIYSTVSGIWNYYPYAVSYCPTFADAIHYAANVEYDYKDSLSRIPENDDYFEYEEPVVTLLNNVTIPAGTSVGELTYDVIYIDLNGKSLNNLGTLTGVDGYDRTTFVIESEVPGTFRSSGNIAADLTFWNGDTAYITGGTISGYFYAYGGTHHITGGVFTAETMFSNGNPEAALNAYISGNARFDAGLEYYVDSNSDYIEPNMVINGNVLVNGMDFSISYVNPDDCSFMGDVLTVNNGYFADDPHDFYPGNSYDDAINISGTIEEYGSQTDWAADPSVYLWRVVTLPNLTYSFKSGGSLIANIENAPAASVLVAARYDAFGKVTDLQKVSDPGDTHTFTMAGSGSCYRLFLFDSLDTLMPLCEAWEN